MGVLYAYLAGFPLRRGAAWAWWLLAVSGTAGFLSFLAYLGYDALHLLPPVLGPVSLVAGLALTFPSAYRDAAGRQPEAYPAP